MAKPLPSPGPQTLRAAARSSRAKGPRVAALLAGVLLVTAACEAPIRVSTDRDPGADFSRFGSYAWISPDPLIPQVQGVTAGRPMSPIDDGRIRDAVDTELATRGWLEAEETDQADLIVSYGLGAESRTEVYETPTSAGYYGYRRGGWYASSTVRTRQVTEGTLTLEFFDRRTKQAVWAGWASKRIPQGGSKDPDKTIREAVAKILETFPATAN